MRIVSPILTIATLASGASAVATASATDKDDARARARATDRKRTIFHKVVDESNANDAATTQALLDNVKAARQRRNSNRSGTSNMEKKTKVKLEDVAMKSLSRRSINNKKKLIKNKKVDSSAAGDGSAGINKKDSSQTSTAYANMIPRAASTAGLRRTDSDTALNKDSAPRVQRDGSVQELMQKRRKDRAADLVRKKERKANAASNTTTTKKQRRVASSSEARTPNPRPGRKTNKVVSARTSKNNVNKEEETNPAAPAVVHQPRPGYDKRDLKKSKKSSGSTTTTSTSGDGNEKTCEIRLTNLTKEQWFSDIFWMVHSDKVEQLPLFEYGKLAYDDLALLAQDGDPSELIDFFEDNDEGVLEVDAERGPLESGESIVFEIPKSGSYDLLTMATSFMFANDGFVAIDSGEIEDEAEWYLWGNDAGVEANTQLCWTVQATSADFPPTSECAYIKDNIADENDNEFPGEGFVFVHSGIHDLRDKNDLKDFLAFTCDDLDADSFVEYFYEIGFDDDYLLYEDDKGRFDRDDKDFLDVLEDYDDLYENYIIVEIALEAGNFNTFCSDLEDIEDFLYNAFETLEPQVFDFRTPMMHVEIEC